MPVEWYEEQRSQPSSKREEVAKIACKECLVEDDAARSERMTGDVLLDHDEDDEQRCASEPGNGNRVVPRNIRAAIETDK
jgi:hypothetical protein